MFVFALDSTRKLLLTTAFAALLAMGSSSVKAQDDDPPAEAGRIASVSGTVSIQPVGTQEWGQAYPNLTMGAGDRIFTDSDGRAEVQVGQTYVRIGPNSDVTLVDDSQFAITFGVAQGSVHLHTYGLWPRQLMGVSTPNGSAEFEKSGDLRVDVYATDGATVFTNYGNFADVTGAGGYRQELDNGQSLQLSGSNPVYPQWLEPAAADDLDAWSQQRDQQLTHVDSYQYVSPDVPGAADLDASGDWQPDTDYGPMWIPRAVPADWAPYHYGHWVNHEPWGWVWVEDESWGYAPFHYGRWVSYRGRWGWIPGPPTVRPVYSPALVVFAGGISFGGGGVSAWFPLGPGEAYRPWYRCSPRYIDRVNITNIRESRQVHVRNTYVNIVNVTNVTYVNQSRGYTAMRHDDFASGRSARNSSVRVDPREMERARPLQRPEPAPTQQSFVPRPVAHPVRVSTQRPTLINQQGQQIVARPGATPVAAPVRPTAGPRPIPGRIAIASPTRGGQGNQGGRPGQERPDRNPNQPGTNPANTGNPGNPVNPGGPGGQPRPMPQPGGRPIPPNAGQQERNPNQPPTYPGGQIRPTPQPPVPPSGRPNQPIRPFNPNQPPAANPGSESRPTPQPPAQPSGRPVEPNPGQQERNPSQPPATYPGGQPRPTPQPTQPSERPAPPNAGQQDRNQYRPPANYPGGQPRPTPQPPVQPSERPAPPNAGQQDRNQYRPPANYPGGQPRPTPQPPPANRPYNPPPAQPAPPPQRPEFRPAPPPPNQRPETRPEPPPQNRPEARPAPPPPNRPEARPAPPPPNRPEARPAPPPPNRPEQPKKDEKKDEKKPRD
jgi:hypothetical protein